MISSFGFLTASLLTKKRERKMVNVDVVDLSSIVVAIGGDMVADEVLEYALKNDNISNFEQKLCDYLSSDVITCINNPLLWAYRYGSIYCASEIVRLKAALACARHHPDGYTATHTICEIGDVKMVKRLLEICPPRLCFLRDLTHCRTPLHVAAVNGNERVLREIVKVCPQSLTTYTSQNETALHLTLKHGHVGCFQVLLDQLVHLVDDQMINLKELLNHKDHEGNTLLHIATDRRQVQILKMLRFANPTIALLLDLKASNLSGLTALNLHENHLTNCRGIGTTAIDFHENHSWVINMEITNLLLPDTPGPNNSEMMKEEEQSQNAANKRSHILMLKTLLLTLFIFVAGGTYNSLFNLNTVYAKEHSSYYYDDGIGKATNIISLKDMVTMRVHVPHLFIFMVLNTIAFTGSVVLIVVYTFSFGIIWSFGSGALPLIALGSMCVSYPLFLLKIVPKFSVTIGSLEISSFLVVWLCSLFLIFFPLIPLWLPFKSFLQSSYNIPNNQADGGED